MGSSETKIAPWHSPFASSLRIALIDDTTADDRGCHLRVRNLVRIDIENILRKDNDVGQFARFDRAFCFLASTGKRCTERIAVHRISDAEALRWHEASFRLAFRRLTSDRSLYTFPRIQSNDRPVAAERKMSPVTGEAFPHP